MLMREDLSADTAKATANEPAVRAQSWCALLVLVVLYTASMLDRQIISLLATPLKRDLAITDLQVSLLSGASFALFYCLVGVPIGYLVDRYPRRIVIFVGVLVWSLATALGGLATSYGALLAARFFVGGGEATLSPAAYSLLADSFPRRRLGMAISIFGLGATIGSAASLLLGGAILKHVPDAGVMLGRLHLSAWRLALLCAALPGAACLPLTFTFREPPRRERFGHADRRLFGDSVRFVRSRRGFFAPFFVGNGLLLLCAYAFSAWTPTYLVRHFAISLPAASYMLGAGALIGVPLGLILFGALVDRLYARGMVDAHMRVFAAVGLGYAACGVWLATAPSASSAFGAIFLLYALSGISAIAAAIPLTTPNQFRGQVAALYLLVSNLLGLGLGPTLAAFFTDVVFRSDAMVGWSIALSLALCGPLASALLSLAAAPMRRAVAAAATWTASVDAGA